jgi:hypothetical protein
MVDAALVESLAVLEASDDVADAYALQADWDPLVGGTQVVYVRLRPERIQVWRESDEIAGRTVMRNGAWVASSS